MYACMYVPIQGSVLGCWNTDHLSSARLRFLQAAKHCIADETRVLRQDETRKKGTHLLPDVPTLESVDKPNPQATQVDYNVRQYAVCINGMYIHAYMQLGYVYGTMELGIKLLLHASMTGGKLFFFLSQSVQSKKSWARLDVQLQAESALIIATQCSLQLRQRC